MVGLECGWGNPETLNSMYWDNMDNYGLLWWAERIKEEIEKIKQK